MEIDKLKLTGAIKIFLFFAYLIYFTISNMGLINILEFNSVLKQDIELKKPLISNKCLLLLGGSNIKMGLSAETASSKSCEAVNLGVNIEAGGFNNYFIFINQNISNKKIIYSPFLIWEDQPSFKSNEEFKLKFPPHSIFSIIKNFLFANSDHSSKFNKYGDIIEFNCPKVFNSFKINSNEFTKSNHLVSKEIYARISRLNKDINSNEVFIRVPPIYVKDKKQAELYTKLINDRIELLKGRGVKIVGSTFVSTDSSLFCDSFHPNAKGREKFTKEIVFL